VKTPPYGLLPLLALGLTACFSQVALPQITYDTPLKKVGDSATGTIRYNLKTLYGTSYEANIVTGSRFFFVLCAPPPANDPLFSTSVHPCVSNPEQYPIPATVQITAPVQTVDGTVPPLFGALETSTGILSGTFGVSLKGATGTTPTNLELVVCRLAPNQTEPKQSTFCAFPRLIGGGSELALSFTITP
jgi:hypothetical protein